jgi:hypothetical protein
MILNARIGYFPIKHKSKKYMNAKQVWMIAALSTISLFSLSCGEKKEKASSVASVASSLTLEGAAEKMASLMTQNMDAIMTIKDDDSLKAAEAKIESIGNQLVANAEALKKLPKPDAATRQALSDKMKKGMEAQMETKMKAMQEHMMKLSQEKPELMAKIATLQTKFSEKMMSLSKDMNEYF